MNDDSEAPPPPIESTLLVAMRRVQEGRGRVKRQRALVEKLRKDGHNVRDAEDFLERFMNLQIEFEERYRTLLAKSQESRKARGYKDPLLNWPKG